MPFFVLNLQIKELKLWQMSGEHIRFNYTYAGNLAESSELEQEFKHVYLAFASLSLFFRGMYYIFSIT